VPHSRSLKAINSIPFCIFIESFCATNTVFFHATFSFIGFLIAQTFFWLLIFASQSSGWQQPEFFGVLGGRIGVALLLCVIWFLLGSPCLLQASSQARCLARNSRHVAPILSMPRAARWIWDQKARLQWIHHMLWLSHAASQTDFYRSRRGCIPAASCIIPLPSYLEYLDESYFQMIDTVRAEHKTHAHPY
jgi:hypothetical protein